MGERDAGGELASRTPSSEFSYHILFKRKHGRAERKRDPARKREEPARTGGKLHLTLERSRVTCSPVAGANSVATPAEERKPAL